MDMGGKLLSFGRRQELAIADVFQPWKTGLWWKDDSSRSHRPGQSAAPYLIQAGDEAITLLPERLFVAEGGHDVHAN